ncbi:MAG: hypothetical protein IIY44_05220 [Erysipelotrichales bacterium]|nr:hypothetical protein [Erysipelotrichales bacterium]MBQ2310622.1 hypothetical protein [Erysipelotrichales bacterium]MBQ2478976.1 hypothetical protein [Erysipelotrichales bacterium]MBQ4375739.1 hypothetical protein [Erysipelotrichales bacterium]MBQ5542472.1 hypothetical protein [Erysipelotrichales bacterium]
MVKKKKELNQMLENVIAPLGFGKIPKTGVYLRKIRNDLFQAVTWWEFYKNEHHLLWWIESVYTDPMWVFHTWLYGEKEAVMNYVDLDVFKPFYVIDCSETVFTDDEYTLAMRENEISEDEQLTVFIEQVLPRLERWKDQKDVFAAHIGAETMYLTKYPSVNIRYWYDREFGLALFLKREDAEQYIDIPLENMKNMIEWSRQNDLTYHGKSEQCFLRNLEQRKAALISEESIQSYLQYCKEQNIKDYSDIMKGKRYVKT